MTKQIRAKRSYTIIAAILIAQAVIMLALNIRILFMYSPTAFTDLLFYNIVSLLVASSGIMLIIKLKRNITINVTTKILLILPLLFSSLLLTLGAPVLLSVFSAPLDRTSYFYDVVLYSFIFLIPTAGISSVLNLLIPLRNLYPGNK